MRRAVLPLALLLAAAGCHKPQTTKAIEEHPVAEHRLLETPDEVERGASPAAGTAPSTVDERAATTEELREERAEIAEAVARERAAYKKMLVREIDLVDRRLHELKSDAMRATGGAREAKDVALAAARAFRTSLKNDLDAIERTAEEDWPAMRERIEHDLDEGRPAEVPRSFEKSYAI